jgi:flagellar basal-body rod protein FlgF
MDNTNYNLIAAQVVAFNNLTTASNNIANIDTSGYKQDNMVFAKYLTQDKHGFNTMPFDRATIVDIKPGSFKQTSRQLDFAISGDAFFTIQTPLGIRYTKSGNFTINNDYELVSVEGYNILTENGNAIAFNQDDVDIIIDSEGRIFARANSQENYSERGKLGIVSVANPKMIRKAGDRNFIVEGNTEVAQSDPTTYKMLQGYVETSNVEPIVAMTNLVEIQQKSGETVAMSKEINALNSNVYSMLSKTGKG